jgi:hypothetical protein
VRGLDRTLHSRSCLEPLCPYRERASSDAKDDWATSDWLGNSSKLARPARGFSFGDDVRGYHRAQANRDWRSRAQGRYFARRRPGIQTCSHHCRATCRRWCLRGPSLLSSMRVAFQRRPTAGVGKLGGCGGCWRGCKHDIGASYVGGLDDSGQRRWSGRLSVRVPSGAAGRLAKRLATTPRRY